MGDSKKTESGEKKGESVWVDGGKREIVRVGGGCY